MSWLSRLFGQGDAPGKSAEPVVYQDFAIFPEPIRDGGKWRVGARIEKEIAGELKTHQLIRADTLESEEAAIEVSTRKAKQVIDEQGERLF